MSKNGQLLFIRGFSERLGSRFKSAPQGQKGPEGPFRPKGRRRAAGAKRPIFSPGEVLDFNLPQRVRGAPGPEGAEAPEGLEAMDGPEGQKGPEGLDGPDGPDIRAGHEGREGGELVRAPWPRLGGARCGGR